MGIIHKVAEGTLLFDNTSESMRLAKARKAITTANIERDKYIHILEKRLQRLESSAEKTALQVEKLATMLELKE